MMFLVRWWKRRFQSSDGFPTRQLFVLALVRICEPIAFMSIFPYSYYMVKYFHVTDQEEVIGLYAGMITSAFTFTEFLSGVFWSRLSDKVGRKPVLIMGLIGTAISMLVFGFAPNYATAILARALGGLLNGNIGVLQTTVAEIVTVKEHQPRAYSIMPFVWCLGSIIGPVMGGALVQPCENYPDFCAPGSLLDRFPFLLPNLACVVILAFGISIGILFLEETHAEKKHRRDLGLELGHWLLGKTFCRPVQGHSLVPPIAEKAELIRDEEFSPFEDDPPPAYTSREATPRSSCAERSRFVILGQDDVEQQCNATQVGFTGAFTKQIVLIIIGYGILAYHSVSFDVLMPIFLETPKPDNPPISPFRFTGGLGKSPKTVGVMNGLQGAYSLFAQLCLFPFLVRRYGTLRAFRFVLVIWTPLYFAVPYLVLLPPILHIPVAQLALLAKITLHVIAFPSVNLLLTNSAPSAAALGSINGAAGSVASLSRALGPTCSTLLNSKGLAIGFSILSWWVCGIISAVGAAESFFVRDVDSRVNDTAAQPEVETEDLSARRRHDSMLTTNQGDVINPEEETRLLLSARTSSDLRS
ncbi:hypothetical protein VTN49DRAFT_6831 [Thermomyces lanuginosus]|uniref:uncharacterized protein n=1 Tax=Thermomyces lanuginosus TaxID=5541 RepID=UPI003742FD5C